MVTIVVSAHSMNYLVAQRGDFAHLAENVSEWYAAYYAEIQKTIEQIGHNPYHVLDIGSGLGAVDALMAKAYGTHCTLVDAEAGDGTCTRHSVPFCNQRAVERFMHDNQVPVNLWRYCDPKKLPTLEPMVYDLVLSLRSWCFHYPPHHYLDYVQKHLCPNGRLLVDVRKNRPEWRAQLRACFTEVYTLEDAEKYSRVMYVARGRTQ